MAKKRKDIYMKRLKSLHLTGKDKEIKQKIKRFDETGRGFSIRFLREDFNIVVNTGGYFLRELGEFKEININSSKSPKINNMIKLTKRKGGYVYYSSITKGKYAFVIPEYSIIARLAEGRESHIKKEYEACYKVVIL